MMIYHIWSIPSLRVITDDRLKLTSFIDTIDTFTLREGDPSVLPPFIMSTKWGRAGDLSEVVHFEQRLSIKGPGDKQKNEVNTLPVDLPAGNKGISVHLKVNGIKVTSPGEWFLFIEWRMKFGERWKKAAMLPITVNIRSNPPEASV